MKNLPAGPWAISRAAYESMIGAADGSKTGAPRAAVGNGGKQGGVAVIPVIGVLTKEAWFQGDSGAMQLIGAAVRQADADASINSIVLHIDSPGGTVDGTEELARTVAAAAKPVIAVVDGQAYSAAYWIASQADAVYLQNRTDGAGSIGVIAAHTDISGFESQIGVKTTLVTAGRYKAATSPFEPLTDDGRSVLQNAVDGIYTIFVDDVAAGRKTSAETVIANMADGRLFMGDEAIGAGLADGYASLGEVIARAQAGEFSKITGRMPHTPIAKETKPMDIAKLKAEHPEIADALYKEGFEVGLKDGVKQGLSEGAEAERQRIKDIEENAMAGHEAAVAEMKFDGKTTGPEAAVRILRAEKAKGAERLGAIQRDAAPLALVPATQPAATASDVSGLPVEERCKAMWDRDKDIRAEFGTLAAYTAFERANERGVVKILSNRKGA